MELKLGFLASHNGTNVEAILNNIKNGKLIATPNVIISNNHDSRVLEIARRNNIPNYFLNSNSFPANYTNTDEAIISALKYHNVNLVLLCGYMKVIPDLIISEYKNRILNIHPSLLPKYGGKGMYGDRVHESLLNSEDMETGVTIHIVNEEIDDGRIISQRKIPRYYSDTLETLKERVLKVEHELYSNTLIKVQREEIVLDSR